MNRKRWIAAALFLVLMAASPMWAAEQETVPADENYIIGPGDVLDISAWNNQALTRMVTVLPDGKIHFPLIGEILAGGKTVGVLQKEIEKKISRFVPNPDLSVMVQQINSMLIYVVGRVNNPGRFVLNTNVNVLQALAMAGGTNSFANRNRIKIIRETGDETLIFKFEYDEVIEGKHLDQNIRLKRGDVVIVP